MASFYLDTTIISYLASPPSRAPDVAAQQVLTHQWWNRAQSQNELLVSEAVIAEVSRGDPQAAQHRLSLCRGLEVLLFTEDVYDLADCYKGELGLTGKAEADILHVAFAVAYEVDYLLTWNCAHIANRRTIRRLLDLNLSLARFTPIIVSPEDLCDPFVGGLP